MPLPLAHGLVGAGVVAALHPRPSRRRYAPLFLGALLANCADLDFALVALARDRSYHRGFTHSLAFALALCVVSLAVFGRARLREALAYGLAYASHALLDYSTTKLGGGVELLWPFTSGRFGLGVVGLSELPSLMPSVGILKAALLEILLFAPPLACVLLVRRFTRTPREAE
ncbi:MAG TPA: metal-dependent hydrolase [Pyrinomonadaceae bacterium]|jgi:membrane-bound metal-dependent hydrolase YbcI (DUF457 family)|nr:metal-dependent hydrolase [Pyrinomonadaceae bacterium]